jgi:membrane peptidoglycan carboxypeptidase
LAFEKGYKPESTIEDEPLTIKNSYETYTPVNYDGKFHGKVTLKTALANSYNIPAVKLVKALGPQNMVSLAKSMGLVNWNTTDKYGVSVTLGGKETTLLDLTNTYATFARAGTYKNIQPILSVTDARGYKIYFPEFIENSAISPKTASLITDILSENKARSAAFGAFSQLLVPGFSVAVKTGTTDYKRDNWTIGYTKDYAVGVWVGNNDNKPMNPRLSSGLSGAAPIWNKVFVDLLRQHIQSSQTRKNTV